jgi:hypothetical protein
MKYSSWPQHQQNTAAIKISGEVMLYMCANVQINPFTSRIITTTKETSRVDVSIGRRAGDPQLEGVKFAPLDNQCDEPTS